MAKRKPADPDVQQVDTELAELLQSLDNLGVMIVEEQWRAMSPEENRIAIDWAMKRRTGVPAIVPSFLWPFAHQKLLAEVDQHSVLQADARRTILPVQYLKPSVSKKDENGERRIKMVASVALVSCRGGELDRLFRATHCRIEFSTRAADQWTAPLPGIEDGFPEIIVCVSDFSGYNASRHATRITWLIDEDEFSKNDAYDLEDVTGSMRIEVLGESKKGHASEESEDAPVEKKSRKKKEPQSGPTIPGTSEEELADNHSVSLTDNYRVDIKIVSLAAGKVWCQWSGEGPGSKPCEQGEPSVRSSLQEAVIASIGNAVDHWSANPDDESKKVVGDLKHWLAELEAKKTPKQIEMEAAEEPEDQE